MTVISLAPSSAGCRFPGWCNACDVTLGGERCHWSGYRAFYDAELEDFIGAELYGYENDDDGIDPVSVYLAVGREASEEGGRQIGAEEALALGEKLRDFRHQAERRDRLVHTVNVGDELAVTVEFRAARTRRNGGTRQPRLELSIHGAEPYALRVRLALTRVNDFGANLIAQAQLALDANRFLGLMRQDHNANAQAA